MQTLSEILEEPVTITTPALALSLLRRILVALARDMNTDAKGYKTNRNALYKANRLLADWEYDSAFGSSIIFKSSYPDNDAE